MPAGHMKITKRESPSACCFEFEGRLDETFGADQFPITDRKVLIFDLGKVTEISSHGVRNWRDALRSLRCDYLGFINCRPAVATQFNSVKQFSGSGELLSFFLPYVCAACDHYQERLADVRAEFDLLLTRRPPDVTCEKCGEPSDFDDAPSVYFSYVTSHPRPTPPMEALELLEGSPPAESAARIHTDVQGNVTAFWFAGELGPKLQARRQMMGAEGEVVVVLQDVTRVTSEGSERLSRALPAGTQTPYLARVRLAHVQALLSAPLTKQRFALISVLARALCSKCHTEQDVELTEALLAAYLATARPPPCGACGGPQELRDAERVAAVGPQLLLVTPTEDVSRYLAAARQSPELEPARAKLLLNKYEMIEPLGAGGMAEVSLARQTGVGGFEKRVVIKKILPALAKDETFIKLLLQEARLAARIAHPNVVQTLDVDKANGSYFIVLEYVMGLDLGKLLNVCEQTGRPVPLNIACAIGLGLARGLEAVHGALDEYGQPSPIIHRDVSPQNLLISLKGEVKLSDFGIASSDASRRAQEEGVTRGKLPFVPPELLDGGGGKKDDPRIDIYAAGLTLYQLLTFAKPFHRQTLKEVIHAVSSEPLLPPSSLRPEIPPELDNIVLKAAARPVNGRFPSASDLANALAEVRATLGDVADNAAIAKWVSRSIEDARVVPSMDVVTTPTMVRITSRSQVDEPTPLVSRNVESG